MATSAFRTLDGVRFTNRARVNRTLIRETSISSRENNDFEGENARCSEYDQHADLKSMAESGIAGYLSALEFGAYLTPFWVSVYGPLRSLTNSSGRLTVEGSSFPLGPFEEGHKDIVSRLKDLAFELPRGAASPPGAGIAPRFHEYRQECVSRKSALVSPGQAISYVISTDIRFVQHKADR